SRDGTLVADADEDKVHVLGAGAPVTLHHNGEVAYAAFGPRSRNLVTWDNMQVRLWNRDTGQARTLTGFKTEDSYPAYRAHESFAFSADGVRLAVCKGEKVEIWDLARGERVRTIALLGHKSNGMSFSPRGDVLGVQTWRQVNFYDVATGSLGDACPIRAGVNHFAFRRDGQYFATADEAGKVTLWKTRGAERSGESLDHTGGIDHVRYSTDGRFLISGAEKGGTAHLWDALQRARIASFPCTEFRYGDVSSGRDRLLLQGADPEESYRFARVDLWRLPDIGSGIRSLPFGTRGRGECSYAAFSADGKWLAAVHGFTVRLFPFNDWLMDSIIGGRPRHKPTILVRSEEFMPKICFSPDGARLAVSGKTTRVLTVPGGEQTGATIKHQEGVEHVSFTPDGKHVLTVESYPSRDATKWDLITGRAAAVLHENVETAGPGFRHAITSDYPPAVIELESGKKTGSIAQGVFRMFGSGDAWSSSGGMFAAADSDNVVRAPCAA
ncbi:MAG: WD40 repeat domain-containing protein, partial [Planctomycetota bacterium]